MKKIFYVMATGLLLAACGTGADDASAAKDYCECYDMEMAVAEKTGNAATATELMELTTTLADDIQAYSECYTEFQAKYKEKLSKDGFSSELEKLNPETFKASKDVIDTMFE